MKVYLRKTCNESLSVARALYSGEPIEVVHIWLDDEDCVHELPPHLTTVPTLVDKGSIIVGVVAIIDYLRFKGL